MRNEIIKSTLTNISALVAPAYYIKLPPGSRSDLHMHDELELLYVESGEFTCTANDNSYKAAAGDVIFVNSRVPHITYAHTSDTFISMVQFSPESFSNDSVVNISKYLSRFININKEHAVIFKNGDEDNEELKIYLTNIFEEYRNKKPAYELYIKAQLCNVIAFLSRNDILTDSSIFFNEKTISKVMPALNYIDSHYTEQIQLDDLSKLLNLNQSYFCRLFKQATNSTFIEYLNFVRVCKAERMLSVSADSIGDISLNLGFASVSYFNKIFKRFKGCTPTEYRKSKYSLQ